MHDHLLARRGDYPILDTTTYLINNSLGAMHIGSRAGVERYAELWATRGVTAWETWFPDMTRIADLVGMAIGAEPGTTMLRASVADCISAIASCLSPTSSRNRIVCSAGDWPGSHYLWLRWAQQHGAELVVVDLDHDGIGADAQRIADAIDDRTLAVSLSLVQFRTATLLDPEPIIEKARKHNALFVMDAYQAAGAVPVNVAARGVDVCVGGSVKFLCGGPGNGWMSVRPAIAETLRPAAVGWISHARPFAFEFDEIDYASGVGRFAGGTPNVPAAYAAEAGYQAIADVGVELIRERSMSLTQPIVEAALEQGFSVNSPIDPSRRGGHVTVDPGGTDDEVAALAAQLIENGFVTDHRPGSGIRFAPHFFNRVDEGLAAIAELAAIMDR